MKDAQEALKEPRPNPSGNPENLLFEVWKNTPIGEREPIELRLLSLLRVHASKVCWMVLHAYEPHLIDEIAQDALMDLSSFEERSSFATWFHSRATFRCRTQLKQNIQRKEISLDVGKLDILPRRDSSLETKVMINEMLEKLTPFERELIELKVYEGLTATEIAEILGFTREWIQISWSKLRKKLKEKYNGSSV